ncbi:MAG: response regulator [Sulfuricurvum sp.]|uniref:response regulator n=1 Tax=Sulfuricurvum sp. TaxID=2025608 RepID=UPI002732E58A|nr:response regulator [Sulfuricurvum sp.]MDP2849476.1 response regulator [Sulfuricurvum sp.]MDP3290570.1 response regulator [Sulfuricurvum sp.]
MGLLRFIQEIFGNNKHHFSAGNDETINKEFFYKVLDTDTDPLLFFTKENGWIGANKAFFDLVPLQNIEQLRNKYESIRDLFDHEDEEVFTEYDKSWLDYIRTHCPNGYGLGMVDPSGKMHTMLATSTLIQEGGEDLYLLRLEDQSKLVDLQAEVVKVEQLKSKFLANIGHEFRTPMNGILGFVELLSKTSPNETQLEYIHSVQGSARNLMSNIENLLDLAQMQNGRLNVSKSEFNIVAEMEELARGCISTATDKGVGILFFIDPKLPTYITGDVRKIKQVINNLYNNALKFTQSGGRITVEVKLLKRNTSGTCNIGFTVKDTGKGISKSELSNITRPFVSGDHADNRLGVGLSLSHGLISLMGGELKITSDEGKGSSFSFALTLEGSSDHAMSMINGRSVKVVLIDEKRVEDANHLTNYLRSFGVSVTKTQLIDETIFNDVEVVYLIGSQEKSDWAMNLSEIKRSCKTVLLLEQNERLQAKMLHLVDISLYKPLLPTSLLEHLSNVLNIPQSAPVAAPQIQRGVSALVVEDNLINQRLIKLLLREYGISVVAVSNGDEAVEICRETTFDIVFMDIDMPIKDGILATQEIKAEERYAKVGRMPIIALTALAMEGDREYILGRGLDDYLSKPLTREKLEYVLQKYLHVKV